MADDGASDTIQAYSPEFWRQELDREKKQGGETWRKRAKDVVKRYRDERDTKDTTRKFNILYSNVETLKPAVFGRTPIPVVKRRFAGEDPATRLAGDIIEKALVFAIDDYAFDVQAEKARDDGLLAGRGIIRVKYRPVLVKRKPKQASAPPPPQPMMGAALTPPLPGAMPGMVPAPAAGAPAALPTGAPPSPMMGGPPGGGLMANALAIAPPPGEMRWMLDGAPVDDEDLKYEEDDAEKKAPYIDDLAEEHVQACWHAWRDFRHTPVADWSRVWWVAFRDYLTRDEAEKQFGKSAAKKITYAPGESDEDEKDDDGPKPGRGAIWEVWCKRTKRVYCITNGVDEHLSDKPAPLSLQDFFPCPEPYRPVGTTDKWEPIPEYMIYQDQALEIDGYTERMSVLTDAIKGDGVAPDVIANALKSLKGDGTVAPISDWQSLAEMTGFDFNKLIAWRPVQHFAAALKIISERRQQAKQELYEVTGISDIMRQSTAPNETATAQQLKGNFGQLRLQPRQKPFERFIRAAFRLMAEVIAEKFSRRTLERMTGIDLGSGDLLGTSEARKRGDEVLELLREDRLRSYRIDVETDSMILPDEQADKANTVEYVTAVTGYLKAAGEIVQAQPQMAPLLLEMLRATSRRFKLGRELEEVIEKTVQEMTQAAEQARNQPPAPDPKMIEAQAKAQAQQQESERKTQEAQAKAGAEAAKQEREAQAEMQSMELEAQAQVRAAALEEFKAQAKIEIERVKAEAKAALDRERFDFEREKEGFWAQFEERRAADANSLAHRKQDDAAAVANRKQDAADAARSTP